MTMHLAKGLTTTVSKKYNPSKFTKAQISRYESELLAFNQQCKREGRHSDRMTLNEYIDYCHGIKKPSITKQTFSPLKTKQEPFRREGSTNNIKSLNSSVGGICALPEKKEYTGTAMLGIATMHKSNAVPVFDFDQAKDIASMRR
jgi:hypothetical protein